METMSPSSLFTSYLVLFFLSGSYVCYDGVLSTHSIDLDVSESESQGERSEPFFLVNFSRARRNADSDVNHNETEFEHEDICEDQKRNFSEVLKNNERLEETHTFANESKSNLALVWAEENDTGILLVLTSDVSLLSASSTLWRSTNYGRTWEDWTGHVDNRVFRKDGLQINPHEPKKLYLISYEHYMYMTEDSGETWLKQEITDGESTRTQFTVVQQLEFHPDKDFADYILIITNDRQLYVTYDNFQSSIGDPIKSYVYSFKWGTKETNSQEMIFVTTGEFTQGPFLMSLERFNGTAGWTTILSRVSTFYIEGKFMCASIFKSEHPINEEDERIMMISSDGGNTWNAAQLPTLTADRFFAVLDMSEGLIFMHVDNPGDTGHGVLYTSASDGIVYSESLTNHLYPNYNNVHDFYKVKSVQGVYLASQMGRDNSIHTVITFNRGAEWRNITRPVNEPCEDTSGNNCFLQINSAYSIHRGRNAQQPLSLKNAYGLILVHGHVASNLQTTPPDVFISNDGGYNFRKVLNGPHVYQIADSGGLIVAVSLEDPYPDTVKFSLDEGHCWHTYKFTNETLKFTSLLTGDRSMTVSVWGYTKDTKKWTINIIDFNKVVTQT